MLSCTSAAAPEKRIDQYLPQRDVHGAPVIEHAKLVPVFFADDPSSAKLDDLTRKLVVSSYWGALAEYGVGTATVGPAIHLKATAPPAGQNPDDWMLAAVNQAPATLSTPDESTVYVLFWPSGSPFTLASVGASCKDLGGYHGALSQGDRVLPYAVVLECLQTPSYRAGGVVLGIDLVTDAAVHEIVETVTDPRASFRHLPEEFGAYEVVGGGVEIGDMCTALPLLRPADIGYAVPRVWSDRAARAGSDPCVPEGVGPYFLGVPTGGETVEIQRTNRIARGYVVPLGESRTIDVKLVAQDSPGSGAQMTVSAIAALDQDSIPKLGFAWDRTGGMPGDVLHLTVTALTDKTSAFFVKAMRGGDATYAPAVVVPRR